METVATEPTFKVLLFKQGAAVEVLADYGRRRYHLLVQHNDVEDSCAENTLLGKVYDALDAEDDGALDEALDEFILLVRPLMAADYAERVTSKDVPNGTIKLRA